MNNTRKLILIFALSILGLAMVNGCGSISIKNVLLQHAVGGVYDPTDQIAEDQLNAILKAVEAQDAAAIKAQFAPNAIAAQPELDSQIEALLDYYAGGEGKRRFFPYKAATHQRWKAKPALLLCVGGLLRTRHISSICALSQKTVPTQKMLVFGHSFCSVQSTSRIILTITYIL